ncbi:MAG TPA: hypothetical protein VFL91_09420 [Thermomicrobiales bacterium]|nr:hypothetical protein [Thermomicrobiales bacterium]
MDQESQTPPPGPAPREEWVSIAIVPPTMADGTPAQALQTALAEASRTDRAALADLAGQMPWLTPLRPFACGYHLMTEGLRDLTGGPDLEVANVPGPFVRAAADLLDSVARYAVTNGAGLEPGQVIALEGSRYAILLQAVDDAAAADGEPDAGAPGGAPPARLRLVFLS